MKKKKKTFTSALIREPVRPKIVVTLILTASLLTIINIAALKQWEKHKVTPQVTQANLLQVLGASISVNSAEQEKNTQALQYWKKVVADKPTYRDGYLMLSVLSFNLNNCTDAVSYFRQAKNIDPNHEQTKELESLLSPCFESEQEHS